MMFRPLIGLIFAAFLASQASAQVFSDLDSFLLAAGSTSFESFEDLTATNRPFPGNLKTVVVDDFSIMNNSVGPNLGVNSFGYIYDATDGNQQVTWYASGPATEVVFTFDQTINAFGLNIMGYGDINSQDLLFLTDTGVNGTAAFAGGAESNVQFFGIVSPGMTSITFDRTTMSDAMGFDGVHFVPVPEPATGVATILCMVGVACFNRHRL